MKRLLSILFSVIALTASAQVTVYTSAPAPTTAINVTTAGQYADAVNIKRMVDSVAALRSSANSNRAAITTLQSNSATAGTSLYSRHVQSLRSAGATIQAETDAGTHMQINNTTTGLPERTQGFLITLPVGATINGAMMQITNVPAYTATQGGTFQIYATTPGSLTLTRVAISAQNFSLFKPSAAGGFITAAFTSPFVPQAGVAYYLSYTYYQDNQTTAPQFAGYSSVNGNNEIRNKLPGMSFYTTWSTTDFNAPATIQFSQLQGAQFTRPWMATY